MREYINPKMEIQYLQNADVITSSVTVTKDSDGEYLIGVSDSWWSMRRG